MAAEQVLIPVLIFVPAIYFVYREHRRKNHARYWLRIAATILAFAAIFLLLCPISFETKKIASGKNAVLLTDGYAEKDFDSIPNLKVLHQYHVNELPLIPGDIDTLHIFGYGVPVDTRPFAPGIKVVLHNTEKQTGVQYVSWNRMPARGESIRLQGRYFNKNPKPVLLKLIAFGIVQDSVSIQPDRESRFQLHAIPKFSGLGVLNLIAISNGDTLENNAVPVKIINAEKPRIIFFSSSPGFEQKFLLDWLGDNGYSVLSKTRISKDRFEKRLIGFPKNLPERITRALVNASQLLIFDAEEFNRLAAGEKQVIYNAVAEKGLGLLIRIDSILPESNLLRTKFSIQHLHKPDNSIRISGINEGRSVRLLFDGNLKYLKPGSGTRTLLQDSTGHMLAGAVKYGSGNIALSVMPSVYSLALGGDKEDFAKLWTNLIGPLTGQESDRGFIEFNREFPVPDEPVFITLRSGIQKKPWLNMDSVRISLKQDPFLSEFFAGKFWPRRPGWVKAFSESDTVTTYIFNSNEWRNIRMHERTEFTRQLIKNDNGKQSGIMREGRLREKIPAIILYVILILSAVFLWVEKKFA